MMVLREPALAPDPAESADSSRNPIRFRIRYQDHEIPVFQGCFVIGRSPECDLRLASPHVSRRHLALRVDADGMWVEDLGSRNGVSVNGRTITKPTRLSHGDVVCAGIDPITVVDGTVARPERCSPTIRPAPPPVIPFGESDADDANSVTIHVRLARLSKREREVFTLMAQGLTHREIAQKLCVSIKTVETHRTRIGEKLGCRNLREIIHSAYKGGALDA